MVFWSRLPNARSVTSNPSAVRLAQKAANDASAWWVNVYQMFAVPSP